MPVRTARTKSALIHQFLVVLADTDPLVWRRIQVPSRYSFWDLHVAIQDAMGWQDYHLHEFTVVHKRGISSDRNSRPGRAGSTPMRGRVADAGVSDTRGRPVADQVPVRPSATGGNMSWCTREHGKRTRL